MKCPNCNAEIGNNKFCEYCGSQITPEMRTVQEKLNKQGCPKCGSSNISFSREKQSEIRAKGRTTVVRSTVGVCKDCGYTWHVEGSTTKKRNTLLWVLGWIFFFPAPVMVLIWRKSNKWDIKVKIGVTIAFWVLLFALGGANGKKDTSEASAAPAESSENTELAEVNTSDVSPENESKKDAETQDPLKTELKEKYDISEPERFVKGDTTGRWRITKVANATSPSEYAVDYAKAYMNEGDIHFVVNFSLNTTTMLKRYSNGTTSIVEAKTTEYIDKEEHDASSIGEGLLLTDKFFDINTGEQITTEGNEEAGTVDADTLVTTVEEVIEGQVGKGEAITGVDFDGNNLTVYVDMSGADTSIFTAYDIALSRISSITDQILALGDEYYNTWNTVTVDFGDVGKAVLDKSIVKDEGFGKYFDFTDDYLK